MSNYPVQNSNVFQVTALQLSVTVQRPTLCKATIRKQYLWLNMIIQHYRTYCIFMAWYAIGTTQN